MDLSLKGKRALVTGSTRGLGYATALLLAKEGCRGEKHPALFHRFRAQPWLVLKSPAPILSQAERRADSPREMRLWCGARRVYIDPSSAKRARAG